ncbi:bifunctional 4-hydroxy-2-oxoglutarate aldolase/2-dehydro-3-deoxy-phosphogluconate aldolase [Pseudomonas aeruginosa]|uniref:bifunctional 4-hydroxy-2-oxoglutarate aldolase/2-dehydro-3-deoxy-phosphogluconate aldolase n=1 Tax=Pseudomonas aeruginosa TaxID=287 RepID=UPI001BFF88FA|nr:bifunctional 4-hydroxy-2-oxoglutarate aldolase/2-dehydro-3-deoxy-phosphogluconate aldolase [Pseudomonas aeruginosa]MBT9116937.1 bifunctional 4-hydroxy-2-oxoglutarate aldolase/2-dehydro-3-deoxy-phosphogluconate aldolase [Pseudomonas aeruginosa]
MHNLEQKTARIDTLCREARILPVITIDREADILPMADALAAGGLTALEITLRIGAGTVLDPQTFAAAEKAGASFVVTPGCTDELLRFALDSEVPLLPGVASASEIMLAYRHGYRRFKLFPAEVSGGPAALKAFSGPFPDIRFCPTGGVSLNNLADYLAVPNVMCVGGTWMLPKAVVDRGDWAQVERLSREALERFAEHRRH